MASRRHLASTCCFRLTTCRLCSGYRDLRRSVGGSAAQWRHGAAGATLLLNPSASNELLTKVDYRRDLVQQQSARCLAAYLYAGSGPNRSTTDTVWAGHALIAENGAILAETERFRFDTQIAIADVDVQRLVHERLRNSTFAASTGSRTFRTVPFNLPGEPLSTSEVFRDLGGLRQVDGSHQTSEVTEDLGSRCR